MKDILSVPSGRTCFFFWSETTTEEYVVENGIALPSPFSYWIGGSADDGVNRVNNMTYRRDYSGI